jgi:hypothetical protein
VGVRQEGFESDGRDNGKKHLGTEPDDECEIEKSAQKRLHWARIQGKTAETIGEMLLRKA